MTGDGGKLKILQQGHFIEALFDSNNILFTTSCVLSTCNVNLLPSPDSISTRPLRVQQAFLALTTMGHFGHLSQQKSNPKHSFFSQLLLISFSLF